MSRGIEDFGEKIGGAKKDLWKTRGMIIDDLDNIELREYDELVTKNNVWNVPDYVQYLNHGMEPVCIYFMKMVRDKIQPKIQVKNDGGDRERAVSYINFIRDVEDCCKNTIKQGDIRTFFERLIEGKGYRIDGRWTTKVYRTPGLSNSFLRAIQVYAAYERELGYETEIQGFPYNFRGDLKGVTIREGYGNKFYICKGNKIFVRDVGFKTVEEAMLFAKTVMIERLDENKKDGETKGNKTNKVVRPQLRHIRRTGPDIRRGKNVTTNILLEFFKFRGGEFGNWNTQDDRQQFINYAFDALADLGFVMGVNPAFISLGGGRKLAIAFGARGTGNALAHYEPSRVVINLTKMRGAGCLAHEWGHAFDDFLGNKCGCIKYLSEASYGEARSHIEVARSFKILMESIINSKFYSDAYKLDRGKSKPYYSLNRELFARAFEAYIEDKLPFKSEYLVHSTKDNGLYGNLSPYPDGSCRDRINSNMENMIKLVVDTFGTEYNKFDYGIYKNNDDLRDKYDENYTPKASTETQARGREIEGRAVEREKEYEAKDSKYVREKLLENVHKLTPGRIKFSTEIMYGVLRESLTFGLKMGETYEDNVPAKLARGNSKGWMIRNGRLVIDHNGSIQKKVESLIEPMVMVKVNSIYNGHPNAMRIAEGVTYMICKRMGLDVRTYCTSNEYDGLAKNDKSMRAYEEVCVKAYLGIMKELGLERFMSN